MKPDPLHHLPEKLGQLLAVQHTVLAAKVLRAFTSGRGVEGQYKVNGIVIDEIVGTVESISNVYCSHVLSIFSLLLNIFQGFSFKSILSLSVLFLGPIWKPLLSSLLRTGNSMANFLRSGLDLSPSFLRSFLFVGSPDMLIRKNSVVVLSSDSDASDELALENCHQRSPLKPDPLHHLPEKLGQLLAVQHTVLAAKVLRAFTSGRGV